MDYDQAHRTSYERALNNTFATTYGTSYMNVDTMHKSPVYTERDFYSPPPAPTIKYPRLSYPYQEGPERPQEQKLRPWKGFLDYEYDQDPHNRPPLSERREYVDERLKQKGHPLPPRKDIPAGHREIITMPIEKKSCHACREPEAYSPKNTNQLRCYHKYCDNCINNLYSTTELFGDVSARYFHCAICPNSKTAGPTVLRFDPYGRRVVPLHESVIAIDKKQKKYDDIVANPDDLNESHHTRPFCHGCFNRNECVRQLCCTHRFCDACFNKLHCSDNPFRYTTCLHYFCKICSEKTPESKVVRIDPYGRKLLKFRDLNYYNYPH